MPPDNLNKKKVLIAEDDNDIARVVMAYLEREGFNVIHAINGDEALRIMQQNQLDFIILDIKMPKKDGWEVLSELRKTTEVPVMMLTALDTDFDKIYALKTGADDYIVKPFNPAEIVARVQVILRRVQHHVKDDEKSVYKTKNIELNLINHQIFIGEERREVSGIITSTEFRILAHLIRFPKRVFTREEIIAACIPGGDISERTVDSHISKLRKKMYSNGIPCVPESVRGFGYRFGD